MLVPDDVEQGTRRFRPAVTAQARDSELQLEVDGFPIRPLSMSAGPDLLAGHSSLQTSADRVEERRIHAQFGTDAGCAPFGDCALAIAWLTSHFDAAQMRSKVKTPPPMAVTTSRPLLKGASVWL